MLGRLVAGSSKGQLSDKIISPYYRGSISDKYASYTTHFIAEQTFTQMLEGDIFTLKTIIFHTYLF